MENAPDASKTFSTAPADTMDSTSGTLTTATITTPTVGDDDQHELKDSQQKQQQTRHDIHTLVIDTGPIIHNSASASLFQSKAEVLVTLPSVVSEIRDESTRSAFATLWKPFLQLRTPKSESVKHVADFAKRTGDYAALSVTDLQVLGLTYEIWKEKGSVKAEVEEKPKKQRRSKRLMKKTAIATTSAAATGEKKNTKGEESSSVTAAEDAGWETIPKGKGAKVKKGIKESKQQQLANDASVVTPEPVDPAAEQLLREHQMEESMASMNISSDKPAVPPPEQTPHEVVMESESSDNEDNEEEPTTSTTGEAASTTKKGEGNEDEDEDDNAGAGEWITPENLPSHLENTSSTTTSKPRSKQIPVACSTSDFAMQNVLLQLHISLFSPTSFYRILSTRTSVLRCHGCFHIIRHDLSKQFCPSCGGATLTRVSAGTDSDGKFKVFLSKNWQWNNRGNVYAIPKPRGGTASMKGVREELILREDQKEYERKVKEGKKKKEIDLMDMDYLPSLLGGDRGGGGGQVKGGSVKVGTGRNVNAVKRAGKK